MITQSGSAIWAIVPAAGCGVRMAADCPKQYLRIGDHPIIYYSIRPLAIHPQIKQVLVALQQDDLYWQYVHFPVDWLVKTIPGSSSRALSVYNGLLALEHVACENDWVLVHDAVRPCLDGDLLNRFLNVLEGDSVGGLLASPVTETIKQVDSQGRVIATVGKDQLWGAQTPQMFRYGILCTSYKLALSNKILITDESCVVEHAGHQPKIIKSDGCNIKLTVPTDLALVKYNLLSEGSY